MARSLNGTTDVILTPSLDLSAQTKVSVSAWVYSSALGNSFAWVHNESGGSFNNGFYMKPFNGSSLCEVGMPTTTNVFRIGTCAKASNNAWHHYLVTYDRGGNAMQLWIDGVAQTLSLTGGAPTGNYANAALRLGAFSGGGNLTGRMCEIAVWSGVLLGLADAKALAAGAAAQQIRKASLGWHWPLLGGDSPEPDYGGTQKSGVLTGTAFVAHPGVMPGLFPPRSMSSQGGPV